MLHPEVKGGFVPLIKDWKDLMSEVSEKQSLCGSLKDSRFFGPFKDQVDKFEEKLALLDELLLCMNKVQRKWVYLEPIFGRGSLPREKERFDKVNNQYPPDHEECWIAEESELLVQLDNLLGSFIVSGKGCLPVFGVHTSFEMYFFYLLLSFATQ